jgi:hypothetical protein
MYCTSRHTIHTSWPRPASKSLRHAKLDKAGQGRAGLSWAGLPHVRRPNQPPRSRMPRTPQHASTHARTPSYPRSTARGAAAGRGGTARCSQSGLHVVVRSIINHLCWLAGLLACVLCPDSMYVLYVHGNVSPQRTYMSLATWLLWERLVRRACLAHPLCVPNIYAYVCM